MRGRSQSDGEVGARAKSQRGLTAIGIFLFFGAVMACLARTTLLWPGTVPDRIWALNPTAHKQLVPLGRAVGILFLVLSVAQAVAETGWFKRRIWGWRLAVVILATQIVGDLVNAFRGEYVKGAVGLAIGAALLFYLLRPAVRTALGSSRVSSTR
jgi:hypothetical protein